MALDRSSPRPAPLWGARMVEWGFLAIVILVLGGIFGYYAYRVQGQAERAAIQSTLGALRTALVVDHLKQVVGSDKTPRQDPVNPFLVLQSPPVNYAGTVSGRDVAAVAPGSWVFDGECACVGYKPAHPEWLDRPAEIPVLWFRETGLTGLVQLEAMGRYLWQGSHID